MYNIIVSEFTTFQNYKETKFKTNNVLYWLPITDDIGIVCISSKETVQASSKVILLS
jgi:hypothetical protein